MGYIIGVFMAALSFLLNRKLLAIVGAKTIISFSPAAEEAAKTLLPFYLGADVLASHVTFGAIEGVYHWRNSAYQGRKNAFFSLFGHALFGGLTVLFLYLTGSVWLGFAVGLAVHLLWNITVIRFF